MAKGIYERKGQYGDVTYYIRYQFTARDTEGRQVIKDLKERVGRKSRGFTREMAKKALRAREGEITQGRFNLDKAKKPHQFSELVERYHKHAASYKLSYHRVNPLDFRPTFSLRSLMTCLPSVSLAVNW